MNISKCEANSSCRGMLLLQGDIFIVQDTTPVKVGDKYKNYPATVIQVLHKPKKWWQFWKRKEQIGVKVRWGEG